MEVEVKQSYLSVELINDEKLYLFYFNVLMMKIMIEGCINAFFLKEL
jgi:hypothetical protein